MIPAFPTKKKFKSNIMSSSGQGSWKNLFGGASRAMAKRNLGKNIHLVI